MNRIIAIAFVFSVIYFIFPLSVSAQVVINEFVPDSATEWVEFKNSSASAEYLKDYWIDDDTDFTGDGGSSAKKLMTGLDISNPVYPFFDLSSFLNNSGDYVVLFDPSGVIVDQYQYTSSVGENVSVGRNPDGTGSFVILESTTKSSQNSGPQPTSSPTPDLTQATTSAPTPVSTVTPIKTPTTVPTKSPTPKPTATSGESKPTPEESSVLGETATSGTPHTSGEPELTPEVKPEKKKLPFLPIIFIASGVLMIGFAVYNLVRAGKSTI